MRIAIVVLSLWLSVSPALADKAWFSESELTREYDATVFPFYVSMRSGVLKTSDGVVLKWRKAEVPHERGALVLVPGYNQSHLQFAELLYGFNRLGYSVYMVDARGMGFSSRLLPDAEKAYVGSFYDYVSDLELFVSRVVNAIPHQHTFLLAHSMGGLVGLLYQAMYPGRFDAIVLSAPMVQVPTGKYSEFGALALGRLAALAFQSKKYAPGQGPTNWNALSFESQQNTHSRVRYAIKERNWRRYPITKLGGATYGWGLRAISASRWMRKHAPARMTVPVLLLQADIETTVVKAPQATVCDQMPDCRRVELAGSYHEILWEVDAIRDRALSEIEGFLRAHGG